MVQKEESFGIHKPMPPAQTASPARTGEVPVAAMSGAMTAAVVTKDTVIEPSPILSTWVRIKASTISGIPKDCSVFTR